MIRTESFESRHLFSDPVRLPIRRDKTAAIPLLNKTCILKWINWELPHQIKNLQSNITLLLYTYRKFLLLFINRLKSKSLSLNISSYLSHKKFQPLPTNISSFDFCQILLSIRISTFLYPFESQKKGGGAGRGGGGEEGERKNSNHSIQRRVPLPSINNTDLFPLVFHNQSRKL